LARFRACPKAGPACHPSLMRSLPVITCYGCWVGAALAISFIVERLWIGFRHSFNQPQPV
jgi:hypothetical protein